MSRRGLTANGVKLLACLSMLVDHTGYLLFPQLEWLRWIGRLALPLFAFMVAEGCRHTHNRRRYFLRMLGLGLACQLVYLAEGLPHGGTTAILLNILLTLSAAQLICFAWLDWESAYRQRQGQGIALLRFLLTVAACTAVNAFGLTLAPLIGVTVVFDYGLAGMLLPLFALLFTGRIPRLLSFAVGVVMLCFSLCRQMPYCWFALLALPILALYNGRRGSHRLQVWFYAFYPAHLAVLYGIQLLFW
ncbi:MAG: hypothetical protein IJO76_06100 [Clostridia bacterium]|nr:hypothetical protein [Clostridia bacterium]